MSVGNTLMTIAHKFKTICMYVCHESIKTYYTEGSVWLGCHRLGWHHCVRYGLCPPDAQEDVRASARGWDEYDMSIYVRMDRNVTPAHRFREHGMSIYARIKETGSCTTTRALPSQRDFQRPDSTTACNKYMPARIPLGADAEPAIVVLTYYN